MISTHARNGDVPDWAQDLVVAPQSAVEIATLTAHGRVVREPSRVATEYDDVFVSTPRSELFSLLMLVQPPRWMKGLWGDEKDGWRDARTGEFFSFRQMRDLIDDRIRELGLNAELVHEHPTSRRNFVEDQQFWNLSFDQRMARFKAVSRGEIL